jgi:hypothetical protein
MKKLLLVLLCVFLLVWVWSPAFAIIITPDVEFIVGNETYKVNATMVFSQIIIDATYIIFNTTGFYVFSPNSIMITLVYISNNFGGATNGTKVLDFYATTSSGTVWFNLSGFRQGYNYTVKRNGNTVGTITANASGYIHYSNTVWSGVQRFQIYQQGQASGDVTPPVISQVGVTASSPRDTQVGYGWENFSCTVTDNVAVSSVVLRLTNPDLSTTNVAMSKKLGTSTYYTNRSLSLQGNYSYRVQATDTSGNGALSLSYLFSLPPNWDVNTDGVITILDLVLVSNEYGHTGAHGWVREDVDNNGVIQVLDIVLVSSHFGESWWV